ncbi:hypothetical protein AVEN_160599-1 [Araneus ventricosus]|uniref:Uncharacterized protein n=1 Tax=Araneus ventricosus TaxID=182803 RepID=A0A4Y2QSB8_ARAVE|nr:hypothetical protein AVEN_32533-1 [Araneus ventricosus]GBN66160.1 hypothetical protein AVEN_160599-1 [Araneus ventricosus]
MSVPVMNLIYNSPVCCDEDNAVRISVVEDDLEKVKDVTTTAPSTSTLGPHSPKQDLKRKGPVEKSCSNSTSRTAGPPSPMGREGVIATEEDVGIKWSPVGQLQQEKRTPGALQGGQLLTYNQGRLNNSQHPGIEAPHQNRN